MATIEAAIKKRQNKQLWMWWILPLVVIGGWFYPVLGYLLPICMLAGMGIALFKGRYWCDWMCPRGSSWDLLLSRVSSNKKVPAFFKSTLFRVLVLAILMTVLVTQLPKAWPSIDGMGQVFVMMLTVTTGVGIVLGIPTQHRNWCTYCPVGTMSNWLGRGKYPLRVSSACNECQKCYEVCPMQIKRWKYRPSNGDWAIVKDWDCLKCGLCVQRCPKKALSFKH